MILVVGATGFLGCEVCRLLALQGTSVRGLVRSTSDRDAVARLHGWGIEVVEGDLKDPVSLDRACTGIVGVVSTATSMRSRQAGDSIEATDLQGQSNLVDAARVAGVERFVYVSVSGRIGSNNPLSRAKRAIEERIRTSGMTYTILRPTHFMEVWLSPALGFDYANARATLYGTGENPIHWISLADIAALAVHCLFDTAAESATLELGGPEALSPRQVVRIFEDISALRFDVQTVPEDALRARQAAATDSLHQTYAALMLAYAAGDATPATGTVRTHPLPVRTVRDYARQVLEAAGPDTR